MNIRKRLVHLADVAWAQRSKSNDPDEEDALVEEEKQLIEQLDADVTTLIKNATAVVGIFVWKHDKGALICSECNGINTHDKRCLIGKLQVSIDTFNECDALAAFENTNA